MSSVYVGWLLAGSEWDRFLFVLSLMLSSRPGRNMYRLLIEIT
jgi:hypothetical protein